MTTDPKTLIERFPLTAEACNLDPLDVPSMLAGIVREYACDNDIGDHNFDSVEQLMQAIEGAQRTKRALAAAKATVDANLKAIAAADQENAKKRDERAASPDGLAASERAVAKGGKATKPRMAKAAKDAKPRRTSALDAAAKVLASAKEPMRAKDLIEQMAAKGLWTSPGGKTPEATPTDAKPTASEDVSSAPTSGAGRADEAIGTVRWYDNFRTLQDRMYEHWPALRDRLVAAERKARALQTLANSAVICEACEALRCWEPHVRVLGNVNAGDLLTAIEAATREAAT